MGLSYRPASHVAWRADNPMPELTLSPSQGSINSATGATLNRNSEHLIDRESIIGYRKTGSPLSKQRDFSDRSMEKQGVNSNSITSLKAYSSHLNWEA